MNTIPTLDSTAPVEVAHEVESLIHRITEELSQKQYLVSNLQQQLDAYQKSHSKSNSDSNTKLKKFQSNVKLLNSEIFQSQEKRLKMNDEISLMRNEMKAEKNTETQILQSMHEIESEMQSQILTLKRSEAKKMGVEKDTMAEDIRMREAQLKAIENEIQKRQATDLQNLNRLLKKATTIEEQMKHEEYYSQMEKTNIAHALFSVSDTDKEIKAELKQKMIDKRYMQYENEQKAIQSKYESLKDEQRIVSERIAEIDEKRNVWNEQMSKGLFSVIKTELNDISEEFMLADIQKIERHSICTAFQMFDDLKTNEKIIHFVSSEMMPEMKEYILSFKENKDVEIEEEKEIIIESNVNYDMRDFLMNFIIHPFIDRYIKSEHDLHAIQQYIEYEESEIEIDEKQIEKKIFQYELTLVDDEILSEMVNEVINEMIVHLYHQSHELFKYSQHLATQFILKSFNLDEELNVIANNCLNQLISDRDNIMLDGERKRFSLRHRVFTLQQLNNKSYEKPVTNIAQLKELFINPQNQQRIENISEKNLKPKKRLWFRNKNKYKQERKSTDLEKDKKQEEFSYSDILAKKREFYEMEQKLNNIQILFLCRLKSGFNDHSWIKSELQHWKNSINIQSEIFVDMNMDDIALRYGLFSICTSSSDSRFIVIGTETGNILLFYLMPETKELALIASTNNDKSIIVSTNAAIKKILINGNNHQIVSLDMDGIVRIYKIVGNNDDNIPTHYKLLELLKLHPGDCYRPTTNTYEIYSKEDINKYQITFIAFHSCLMINGMRPSIMCGTKCGTILKWNLIDTHERNARIIHSFCATNDEPFLSMYSDISSNQMSWIKREYFEAHCVCIQFIGFLEQLSEMFVSVDEQGLICIWKYSKTQWTDYGWYTPAFKYRLDLDDFIYVSTHDSNKEILYDLQSNISENFAYTMKIKKEFQDKQNVRYWKTVLKNKSLVDLFIESECQMDDYLDSEQVCIHSLIYSQKNKKLQRHEKQVKIQKRLNGHLLEGKFCSNQTDIVLLIELNDINTQNNIKILQFRLIHVNDDSDHGKHIDVQSFKVNIKVQSITDVFDWHLSPVLVPPCADYLIVNSKQEMAIYSLHTSQKVSIVQHLVKVERFAKFCFTPDFRYFVQLMVNENSHKNKKVIENRMKIYSIDMKINNVASSFLDAYAGEKCFRINRTPWQYRIQCKSFYFANENIIDYKSHIRKLIQNLVLQTCDQCIAKKSRDM